MKFPDPQAQNVASAGRKAYPFAEEKVRPIRIVGPGTQRKPERRLRIDEKVKAR